MIVTLFLIILGLLGISYSVLLYLLCPCTFLDLLTSFGNIWAFMGFVLIFIAWYRLKNKKKWFSSLNIRMQKIVLSFFTFCTAIALIHLSFAVISGLHTGNSEDAPDAAYLILLGGGVSKDGKLTQPVIKRVDAAATYLRQHSETICAVSGGTLKHLPVAESSALKAALIERGVEEQRIFEDDDALDTIQNYRYSISIFSNMSGKSIEELQNEPIITVTNRFHMGRALYLAKRMGFKKMYGVAASTPALYVPHDYLREACAWMKLEARIILTGQPSPSLLQ